MDAQVDFLASHRTGCLWHRPAYHRRFPLPSRSSSNQCTSTRWPDPPWHRQVRRWREDRWPRPHRARQPSQRRPPLPPLIPKPATPSGRSVRPCHPSRLPPSRWEDVVVVEEAGGHVVDCDGPNVPCLRPAWVRSSDGDRPKEGQIRVAKQLGEAWLPPKDPRRVERRREDGIRSGEWVRR